MGTAGITYQWSIFLASLDPTTGSEQAGRRPVLVISRERLNQVLPVVNALPLTSRKSPQRIIYPNEVLLAAGGRWALKSGGTARGGEAKASPGRMPLG